MTSDLEHAEFDTSRAEHTAASLDKHPFSASVSQRAPSDPRKPHVGPHCEGCSRVTLISPCTQPGCEGWAIVCQGCEGVVDRFVASGGLCELCCAGYGLTLVRRTCDVRRMSDQQKTETTGSRTELGRLFKTFDTVQESVALINYLLSKREVREQLTPEQIAGLGQQSNASLTSLNAVAVNLDGIMPRRTRTVSMTARGELPHEPGQGSLMRAAMADEG